MNDYKIAQNPSSAPVFNIQGWEKKNAAVDKVGQTTKTLLQDIAQLGLQTNRLGSAGKEAASVLEQKQSDAVRTIAGLITNPETQKVDPSLVKAVASAFQAAFQAPVFSLNSTPNKDPDSLDRVAIKKLYDNLPSTWFPEGKPRLIIKTPEDHKPQPR
jgi:hypothetical protein